MGTISGLTSVSVPLVGLLNNTAALFQTNIGHTYESELIYTLSVDVFSASLLNIQGLTDAGVGIALWSNGAEVANSQTAPSGTVRIDVLTDYSARISLDYVAVAGVNGQNIGVELFAGRGTGLANVDVLGDVSFDNASLVVIPELSTAALLLLFGLAGIPLLRVRRKRT